MPKRGKPFGCCREETFRFGGYQFRTERRFGYACETETLYCAYQPADRYVSEFAHIGGREGHVHLAGMFRYDELGPRQAVAYLFAPVGHTCVQWPQYTQRSAMMEALLFSILIAFTGHSRMHL